MVDITHENSGELSGKKSHDDLLQLFAIETFEVIDFRLANHLQTVRMDQVEVADQADPAPRQRLAAEQPAGALFASDPRQAKAVALVPIQLLYGQLGHKVTTR